MRRRLIVGLLLGLSVPVFAQSPTPPLAPGEPFRVLADHDGIQTTSYDLILDGIPVLSAPVSSLAGGVIAFAVSSGLPSGMHTAAAISTNTVTFAVIDPTQPPLLIPAAPTDVRIIADPGTPPPPAGDVRDDFDRANGGLGPNWTSQTAALMSIVGNQAQASSAGTRHLAFWSGTALPADHFAQLTVTFVPTSQSFLYVLLRAQETGTSLYDNYNCTAEAGLLVISKILNGSRTQLQAIPTTWQAGDVLRCAIIGNTIQAYRNGIAIGTPQVTGGQLTAGAPGIGGWRSATLDSFVAGASQ
jgi:hypothetical protein